ncbi:pectinesterase inhibitor 28-like [Zingiber officinale]|uniref:pectinesterase inhibitor 28-like n=1 Tax=Zingiber officinale TaxID=94328 RepID=UPI001C4B72AD|nr:pectinesterase inhibitor 28-like [Zingiber officinale]
MAASLPPPSPPLPLFLFFAFAAASSFAVVVHSHRDAPSLAAGSLIASTCNRTLYYDVCVASLSSRPRSRRADLQGLAAIALEVSLAHAKVTVALAKNLSRRHDASGGEGHTYAAWCLRDCVEEYKEAVDVLRQSSAALRRGAYYDVNDLVSSAMTYSDTCESAYADKPGLQSPFAERSEYFFKLCSVAIAIANLLP